MFPSVPSPRRHMLLAVTGSIGVHAALAALLCSLAVDRAPVTAERSTRIRLDLSSYAHLAPLQKPPGQKAVTKRPVATPASAVPSVTNRPKPALPALPAPVPAIPETALATPNGTPERVTQPIAQAAPPLREPETDEAELRQIRELIMHAVSYPAIARRLGQEGIVTVSFILQSDGTVRDAIVCSSSGKRLLDERALQTVLGLSGRFPAPDRQLTLSVPITFTLRQS